MVAQLAAILGEEVVTLLQGINHILEGSNGNTCYLAQLVHVLSVVRLLDVHGLVRTPCRNHLDLETALASLLVITQVINWIVCSTYALYMVAAHKSTCCILWLLQLLVTLVVDFACCLRAQLLVDTESCLELKVCPVVQRITECIRYCLCPLLKLLPVACISTCAETLIYTIGTHSTPLVVVTAQPKLCDALELMIIGNHLRDEVTVIVDDRHFRRMIVIQILRSFGVEQEVFIHKMFHNCNLVF